MLAPPPGLLSLEPDLQALTAPDFTELWSIPWDELDHGPMWADSLPKLIRDLVLGQREWDEFLDELTPAITQEARCTIVYAVTAADGAGSLGSPGLLSAGNSPAQPERLTRRPHRL